MKVLTGDHYGIMKYVNIAKKHIDYKNGEPSLESPVVKMISLDDSSAFILKSKEISVVNYIKQLTLFSSTNSENDYISCFNKLYNGSNTIFVAGTKGLINVYKSIDEDTIEEVSVLNHKLSYEKTHKLIKIANCSKTNEFYALYEDTPIKIFDIEKATVSFKSKNVPNDELDLRVPIFDTDIVEDVEKNGVFYVSTAYGKIRTYDRRAKSQPVADQVDFTNLPIKKINRIIPVESNMICLGDSAGRVCLLEKRKNLIPIKSIAKATGAITDLVYAGDNTIISVSKDRFIRVFDFKLNDEVYKLYLKNQLNSVILVENEFSKKAEQKEEEKSEKEEVEEGYEDENDLLDDEEDDEDCADINWDNVGYDQSFDDEEELDDKNAKKHGFIVIDRKNKKKK